MALLNLLESFPKPQRKTEPGWRKEENKTIARRFDKDFFDGDRVNGYGGYYYDGRWKGVVNKLQEVYGINSGSSVLDIGCAKGFLLYDLQEMIPGIKVAGIDISEYAIGKAMDGYAKYLVKNGLDENEAKERENAARREVLPRMVIGDARRLPWADETFDVVLSINTSHNLPIHELAESINEMNRVCRQKGHQFIQLDSWKDDTEKEKMDRWALTAKTMMSEQDWLIFFSAKGYMGDYFWTKV